MKYLNKKILWIILPLFISCNKAKDPYITTGTKIDSLDHYHWGGGYYRTIIHYNFKYKNKKYKKSYKSKNAKKNYNYLYSKGDSILITFPKSNPNKSTVLKKVIL